MSHYPPYPAYKDSGVEWLGMIPEHWEVKALKWFGTYQNSNVDKKSYEGQAEVRLCNYTDVYYNEFIKDSMNFMPATASKNEIDSMSLNYGDIIITKDSEDSHDIGIPAIVQEGLSNVICGYHLTIIRVASEYQRFIHRLIQSSPTKARFHVESPGITRYGLNQGAIGGLSIVVPPPLEAILLADFIDRETARIDSLITQKTRFIELLKEKRQALITQAVTKGLDPHVKMKDSGVEWLGEVPEHWDIKRLRYVAKLNPSMRIDLLDTDEVSFLPMDAIGENGSIEIDRIRLVGDIKSGYSYFENNDVVFAKVTPCFENGKGAIMRGLNNGTGFGTTEITVLRPKKNILTAYINLIVRCSSFKAFGEGSMTGAGGLKRVPDEFTRNYLIPLPCLDEQQKISEFIATNSSRIDRLIAQSNHSITLLKERRSALITAAVTGQIDLREAA